MKSFFLISILILVLGCSTPQLPDPVFTSIQIEAPDTCLVILDGIEFGYGSMSLIVLQNYPNYLQIGASPFVLLPPVLYNLFKVE